MIILLIIMLQIPSKDFALINNLRCINMHYRFSLRSVKMYSAAGEQNRPTLQCWKVLLRTLRIQVGKERIASRSGASSNVPTWRTQVDSASTICIIAWNKHQNLVKALVRGEVRTTGLMQESLIWTDLCLKPLAAFAIYSVFVNDALLKRLICLWI